MLIARDVLLFIKNYGAMKGLRFVLPVALMALFIACAEEQVDYDENTRDSLLAPQASAADNMVPDDSRPANTGNVDLNTPPAGVPREGNVAAPNDQSNNTEKAERQVRKTGQYNSNEYTPEPPNVRPGNRQPEHTYGDTANRMDGANSVR